MAQDPGDLLHWLHAILIITAILATCFPLIYGTTAWYETMLGRILMLQGVSFALLFDTIMVFTYWQPLNITIQMWIYIGLFIFLALAKSLMIYMVWKLNFRQRFGVSKAKEKVNARHSAGSK
jgi:hypothetical protein